MPIYIHKEVKKPILNSKVCLKQFSLSRNYCEKVITKYNLYNSK